MSKEYTTDDMRTAADALSGPRGEFPTVCGMLRQAADSIDVLRRLADAVNASSGIALCLEKGCGTCVHGKGDCDSLAIVKAIQDINKGRGCDGTVGKPVGADD